MATGFLNSSGRLRPTGIGTPGFSFVLDATKHYYLTDKISGQFRGGAFQLAVKEVHEELAQAVQNGMVAELRSRVAKTGRKQRGTNHLAISLLHERNTEITASGFLVGRESWLEQSPAALYYRRIEEGDAQTFNSNILFTNNHPSLGGPYSQPWSPGGLSSKGTWEDGPTSREMPAGYKHIRMPQFRKGVFVRGIGPFPAYRYSTGGAKAYRRLDVHAIYEKHLNRVGLTIDKK